MAIMRIKNRLLASSPAPPPPSPIPTGKGSRSAAANSGFSTYLDSSKLVPELSLPDYIYRSVVADIDYASLKSRNADAVGSIIKSATEFGVFRISNHGIPAEELRLSALGDEGEACFALLTECCRRRYEDDREEFLWRRSALEAAVERGKEAVGVHKYRDFSIRIENTAAKLEEMAEELTQIIASTGCIQPTKEIQLNDSKLIFCRHNKSRLRDQYSPSSFENMKDCCKCALSLHFPLDHGEFCINSDGGPSSFNASSDTIVVTVGELLEEWSLGKFKSACGELNFAPDLQGRQPSFSIELKYCCPSSFNHALEKRISIANQVFLVLIIALMYKMFTAVIYY